MKFTKLTACILAIATATGAMSALGANSAFSLGFGLQYWDAKDASKFDKDGFGGCNMVARLQPDKYLGIDFRLGASGIWDGKTYHVDGQKYETDVTFTCCPVEAGLVLMLPVNNYITLYGGPGVGYYHYDLDVEVSRKHGHHYHREWDRHYSLDDDFGWYAVAGLTVRLTRHVSLFGEARYTDTETSLKHDDSVEFDCSGFGGQIGLMFDF